MSSNRYKLESTPRRESLSKFEVRDHHVDLDRPNEAREVAAFTPDVQRIANILTLKDGTKPVGSFKFKVFRFPGDIDFMEQVLTGPTLQQGLEYIAYRLQIMAQRIYVAGVDEPGLIYFSEMKAGLDERYHLHGTGTYTYCLKSKRERLDNYRPAELLEGIDRLEREDLLSADEADALRKVCVPASQLTYERHCELKHAMKKHYVLRWSLQEVMQGWKELPQKRIIHLAEALGHPTITKCDVWAFVDGRYIEVTNYFFLCWTSTRGASDASHRQQHTEELDAKEVHIISPPFPSYEQAVNLDITHYFGVSNSMKAAKRMWILAQHDYAAAERASEKMKSQETFQKMEETTRTMMRLKPLFASRAASLAQVMTDMKTIEEILEVYGDVVPMRLLMRHVLRLWKQTLNNIPYELFNRVMEITRKVYPLFQEEEMAFEANASWNAVVDVLVKLPVVGPVCAKVLPARQPAFRRTIEALKFAFQELQPLIAQDVDEFTRDFLSAADMTMRFDVNDAAAGECSPMFRQDSQAF
eukprot:m.81944 g.81944  ORF g.81944 m.81944 type:complete len:528 (+) comp14893_c0_seq1:117-1700(+)